MEAKIFVNLPISNLKKAMDFYSEVGFVNNPQFTDDNGACMVLSNEIYVMLLTHQKFNEFTTKQIADTLFISIYTVRKHIANIYEKLHVNSNTQVMNLAYKNKWI